MTKEQFNELKVGDVVEYNSSGILTGCQFRVDRVLSGYMSVEGVIVKSATGGCLRDKYRVGKEIAGSYESISLVDKGRTKEEASQNSTPKPFAKLELNVQEAAALYYLLGQVGGCPNSSVRKMTDNIYDKVSPQFLKQNFFELDGLFTFNGYVQAETTLEELDRILVENGFLKAPEKPKAAVRHKLKGPDGKWAPKNYRVINYPCSKTGEMKKRHVLWGDFEKGKAGTNVHVEEWCADSKKWCPKTYSLAKVGVVE